MSINVYLEDKFELGTIKGNCLYAVPLPLFVSSSVIDIRTRFAFGELIIGIYSDVGGYPDSLLSTLSLTSTNLDEHIYTGMDPGQGSYWIVCWIARDTSFWAQSTDETKFYLPPVSYGSNNGKGWVVSYNNSILPTTYPNGAKIINYQEFAPFFGVSLGELSGIGGGTSGYSGYSGSGSGSGGSGYSGTSGFSGYSGKSGFSGYSGVSGFSGYSGVSGYSGFSGLGISGFSGYSGVSGFSGDSGVSGFSGDSGVSGFSGYSGFSGFSGYTGVSGFSGTGSNKRSITVVGGRNANLNNSYLRNSDGIPYNTTPFIMPFAATLVYISAATNGAETWDAEVRVAGVTQATLSLVAVSSAYNTYSVSFNAGDQVQLYCNGTAINTPRMTVIFQET